MTPWSSEQRIRLAYENQLLEQQGLGHLVFDDATNATLTTVRGSHRSMSGTEYRLAVWLGLYYPDRMPGLYVLSPNPLVGYGGRKILDYGTSHEMHTWKTDWNSFIKVCHCKEEYWSASVPLVEVVMKGMLWLEAYEAHCRTGAKIDAYSKTY